MKIKVLALVTISIALATTGIVMAIPDKETTQKTQSPQIQQAVKQEPADPTPVPVQTEQALVEEAPATQPAPKPEPIPQPVETVDSVITAQGWDVATMRDCVTPFRVFKPEYFRDVATTKKAVQALKVFASPCGVVTGASRYPDGSIYGLPAGYLQMFETRFNQL